MIKSIRLALLGCLVVAATQSHAFCAQPFAPRFFLGVDAQQVDFDFERTYGDNLFKQSFSDANIWAAVQFYRYVGIGIGYETGNNGNRDVTLNPGDFYLGTLLFPNDGSFTHQTTAKLTGGYIELLGYVPLSQDYCLDLFGTLGGVRKHLTLTDNTVGFDGVALPNPIVRSYDDHKTVVRGSIGLQMIFWEYFGARALVSWEDDAEFHGLKPLENPSASTSVNVNGSFTYGIGVFVTL